MNCAASKRTLDRTELVSLFRRKINKRGVIDVNQFYITCGEYAIKLRVM